MSKLEINRRIYSQSVDSSSQFRPVGLHNRRAISTIVPVSSLHLKPQYDANAQIIRHRIFSDEQIQESIRESLEELRLSEIGAINGLEAPDSDTDRVAIVALDEPERPSLLTEQLDSWSVAQKAVLQCVIMTSLVFLTWGLAFRGYQVGANLAAASTSTAASVLIPDMVIFASIGAYAGMTDMSDAVPVILVAFLTCISGLCFEHFALFAGKGGRLGTSAFLGSVIALGITHKTQPDVVNLHRFYDPQFASYADVTGYTVLNMLLSNVLGVVLTYALRRLRPLLSPVVAGNAVSMVLIILLDSFFQHELSADVRKESAGCILQGSFVGMSALAILSNFSSVLVSGLLSGLITLLCYPVFPHGVGGKRGFMGFLAVNLFVLLCELVRMIGNSVNSSKSSGRQADLRDKRRSSEALLSSVVADSSD